MRSGSTYLAARLGRRGPGPTTTCGAHDHLRVVGAEGERGVRAAEAEGVRERDLDVLLARLVGNVVQVAVGVGRLVVDGRRQDAVMEREHRRNRLDAAG